MSVAVDCQLHASAASNRETVSFRFGMRGQKKREANIISNAVDNGIVRAGHAMHLRLMIGNDTDSMSDTQRIFNSVPVSIVSSILWGQG